MLTTALYIMKVYLLATLEYNKYFFWRLQPLLLNSSGVRVGEVTKVDFDDLFTFRNFSFDHY